MKDDLQSSLQFKLLSRGWEPRADMRDELRPTGGYGAAYIILAAAGFAVGGLATFLLWLVN